MYSIYCISALRFNSLKLDILLDLKNKQTWLSPQHHGCNKSFWRMSCPACCTKGCMWCHQWFDCSYILAQFASNLGRWVCTLLWYKLMAQSRGHRKRGMNQFPSLRCWIEVKLHRRLCHLCFAPLEVLKILK